MMARRHLNAVLLLALLLVIGVAWWSVAGLERILRDGRPVLVELAPVDPRSLMQGDYMALRFAIDARLPRRRDSERLPSYVYVNLDEESRASFASVGDTLPAPAGQIALKIRLRDRRTSVGSNAFFFQEGQGAVYARARWGELRVDDSGRALLTTLRDENLQVLGEQRR